MTLLAVRTDFIRDYTGRYDLVVNDSAFADAGADKYIRAGQRWLDRTFDIAKVESAYRVTLAINTWYAVIPNCRTVHSVWISNSDRERWKLTYRDFLQFRSEMPKDPTLVDNGTPLIYTVGNLRSVPEVANTITLEQFATTVYSTSGTHYANLGVFWLPLTSAAITLEVQGSFYQPTLSSDADVNFWTESEPDVLCMAAARAVEITLRNHQGVLDWTLAIQQQLLGLEFDLADQESAEVHVMEG